MVTNRAFWIKRPLPAFTDGYANLITVTGALAFSFYKIFCHVIVQICLVENNNQVVMVEKLFKYVKQKRVTKYLFVRDKGFPQ